MLLSAFGWRPFRRATHRGFANLGRLLPTYLIAAVGYWAFSTPPQIHEVYAIIALDAERFWPQISLGFVSLLLLALTIWLSGGVALHAARGRAAVSHLLWRLSVCAAAVVPILGLVAGVLEASTSFDVRQLHQTLDALGGIREDTGTSPLMSVPDTLVALKFENARYLDWAITTTVLLALVLFFGFFFADARSRESAGGPSTSVTPVKRYAIRVLLIAGLLLSGLFCLQGLATLDLPHATWLIELGSRTVDLSRVLGIVTLISLFLGTALLVISCAIGVYRKFGIPLLLVLALCAVLASANDLNDNHDLRLLPAPHGNLNFISEHFDKWFKEREAYRAAHFADRPFPVYVVAARGGGIYAANHAALFLARLRDTCPAFAQHLFAVSAVSGGSLGAAVYSGLARQLPIASENADQCSGIFKAPGEIETLARRYLANDFLSPVSAGLLFSDLLQSVLPWPFPLLDRSRAFEASLESTWATSISPTSNPMHDAFLAHWNPATKAPLLALHSTLVETGFQVVISPLTAVRQSEPGIRYLPYNFVLGQDLPLSTAVSVSSRYPGLMPAASVSGGLFKWRFVDGGYSDASGVETGLRMVSSLRDLARIRHYNIAVHLIILADQEKMFGFREGLSEFLTPFRTMLRTWSLRAQLSVINAFEGACAPCAYLAENNDTVAPRRMDAIMHSDVRRIRLSHDVLKPPLGWHLSRFNQEVVASYVGTPDRCFTGPHLQSLMGRLIQAGNVQALEFFQLVNENNCVACSILREVRGQDIPLAVGRPCASDQPGSR